MPARLGCGEGQAQGGLCPTVPPPRPPSAVSHGHGGRPQGFGAHTPEHIQQLEGRSASPAQMVAAAPLAWIVFSASGQPSLEEANRTFLHWC